MYILAIETTGAFASVALADDDKIIGSVMGNDRFSHLQNLMPQIHAVIKDNKLSIDDVGAIAVSNGPGSFTGIRIGVSSARALAQILDIPCIPVSSLEALAYNAKAQVSGHEDVLVCPMLDARRNQVYAGGYVFKDGFPVEVIKAGPYMKDEFLSKTEGYNRILQLGDAADDCPEEIRNQNAESVAILGKRNFERTGGCTFEELKPEYMRMAEAERRLLEKEHHG